MYMQKVVLLACGSYNPPTNMHLRMFEIARDHLHRLGIEVLFGVISPVHDAYGKKDLASANIRLAMLQLALLDTDWIRLSDWETSQETHSRTISVLKYHQSKLNSILNNKLNDNINEQDLNVSWIPNNFQNLINTNLQSVQVKLLCGADLLESFQVPGLWADEDVEAIVGNHGLVVITREKTNPLEFIYTSDLLTKYMTNITVVTEWITNSVSSTKMRRALRRHESVKYLIPDKVREYIMKNELYGWTNTTYKDKECIKHMEQEDAEMKKELQDIKMTIEKIEKNNKNNKVVINGLGRDTWDPATLITDINDFLKQQLNIDIKPKTVAKSTDSTCVVELENELTKKEMLSNKSNLQNYTKERVFINDDLTKKEREKQKPIRLLAKDERKKGKDVKIGHNNITIDGEVWRWDESTGKLEKTQPRN